MKNNNTTDIWAQKIKTALASDNFSEDKKDALLEILLVLENATDVNASHPSLITISYPLMLGAINQKYGLGLHHAIQAIIESEERNNEAFEIELKQSQETDVLDVLDAEVLND